MSALSYVVGLHAVTSLLAHSPERVVRLSVLKDRQQDKKIAEIIASAKALQIPLTIVSKQEFEQLTRGLEHHQGIVALCESAKVYSEADIDALLPSDKPAFILMLDGVQDPHNLGACFRSADAAGVDMIIAPKDKSVGITPVVSKVASGAAETVPFVQVTNLVRAIDQLKEKGIWIYGADAETEQTLYQIDFKGSVAIVLGAEGTGLRRLTREHCDQLMKIPMVGSVASLNVSVATGVCLFEVVRQRGEFK